MIAALNSLPPDLRTLAQQLLQRPRDCHKYDFGRVVVVGGSRSMAGAPALAGMAALRAGAGVVEVAVPVSIAPVVAGFDPALIVHGLPEDDQGGMGTASLAALQDVMQRADVLVCGPGLGRTPALTPLVQALWQDFPRPMVLDADGLNALAALPPAQWPAPAGQRVLTPHCGEFSRLLATQYVGRSAMAADAVRYAKQRAAVLLLKGPRSLITDGLRIAHNGSGGPGLATAGTGDVLSGVIAAIAAQGIAPFEATRLGAWLHGLAGDLSGAELTAPGMTARDVLAALPAAWQSLLI